MGLDESMRVQVSEAVNGGGIVGRLFWDFQGKIISLPQVKAYCPQDEFVDWHRREVFRR
ncbi:restriction endonuclease [Salmonella enterica subsp. enterica serovar Enteritidis]|nr:restriction endonuclease [Salmonella enterica subsp. enterica serovar Enteritidis]